MSRVKPATSGHANVRYIGHRPITGKPEPVAGTKAGRKRQLLHAGHPDRNHDKAGAPGSVAYRHHVRGIALGHVEASKEERRRATQQWDQFRSEGWT